MFSDLATWVGSAIHQSPVGVGIVVATGVMIAISREARCWYLAIHPSQKDLKTGEKANCQSDAQSDKREMEG